MLVLTKTKGLHMLELHSSEIADIAQALSKVQQVLDRASKKSANPHFKSKYAKLEDIWDALRDILPEHGLSVTQIMSPIDGKDYLITMLLHSSGQWLKSIAPLMLEKVTSQGLGSAISYQRRYSLAAITGVCQEDDDGNAASLISRKQVVQVADLLKGHADIYNLIIRQLNDRNIATFDLIPINDFEKLVAHIHNLINKKMEKLQKEIDASLDAKVCEETSLNGECNED